MLWCKGHAVNWKDVKLAHFDISYQFPLFRGCKEEKWGSKWVKRALLPTNHNINVISHKFSLIWECNGRNREMKQIKMCVSHWKPRVNGIPFNARRLMCFVTPFHIIAYPFFHINHNESYIYLYPKSL